MSNRLSGFLIWSDPPALTGAASNLVRLSQRDGAVSGWRAYNYIIKEHIPQIEIEGDPPFTHHLLIKWGGDRLILLSNNYRICDHFLERDLRPSMSAFLRKADIAVHSLVLSMTNFRDVEKLRSSGEQEVVLPGPPSGEAAAEWVGFNRTHNLGYAFGRSDAFAGSLQKVEFEGEDLIAASFFTESFPVVRFRNCGLRRREIEGAGALSSFEILRLGKSGFVSFHVPSSAQAERNRFKEVELLLRSINRWGFIR